MKSWAKVTSNNILELRAVQRIVNLEDLVKRFPTSIYLQRSAFINSISVSKMNVKNEKRKTKNENKRKVSQQRRKMKDGFLSTASILYISC